MNTSIRHSPPVLRSALIGGLFFGLFAQACGSSGGAGPESGGSGGKSETGGTTGSGGKAGSSSAGSGGASLGGAGSGGGDSGSAGKSGSGSGGASSSGAGSGGASLGGAGSGSVSSGSGSSTGGAGPGGSGSSSVGSGGTGKSSSGTGGAGSGGTGTAGSVASGGAGRSNSGTGGAGSSGTGTTGAAGSGGGSAAGGSTGTGSAGAGGSAAFNPCPTTGTACNIMPLGDSITDGVGSSKGGGYRVELFHKAVQAGKAITFVGSATDPNGPATVDGKTFPRNHEGHPGYTVDNSSTTSGISPLVDASISTNHPHIITLMIGTNDLNRNVDPTNFPTRLGALLDRIIKDAPNALVVVAKITPWQDDGTNVNAVEPFNTKIATLVQSYITSGKHVALVDMYTPFRANTNYKSALMNDYLHPNDAGYVIMGDVWYNAIQSYLPTAP